MPLIEVIERPWNMLLGLFLCDLRTCYWATIERVIRVMERRWNGLLEFFERPWKAIERIWNVYAIGGYGLLGLLSGVETGYQGC